ncbi:MAG: VOC family protein [Aquamicrobium sp.]|nr:VOC family protein [Aquamicrobium sp.]
MAKIVHISLKVDDIEASSAFYRDIFGFEIVRTEMKAGRVTRGMTDGAMDLTLMRYDSEDAPEATISGRGPCIHHFGIEVDDRHAFAEKVRAAGGEILSKPEAKAIKFRTPHGIVAEVIDEGAFGG